MLELVLFAAYDRSRTEYTVTYMYRPPMRHAANGISIRRLPYRRLFGMQRKYLSLIISLFSFNAIPRTSRDGQPTD